MASITMKSAASKIVDALAAGKFVGVTYTKPAGGTGVGETRTIVARGQTGQTAQGGIILVTDTKLKSTRRLNLNGLQSVRVNGAAYTVRKS